MKLLDLSLVYCGYKTGAAAVAVVAVIADLAVAADVAVATDVAVAA